MLFKRVGSLTVLVCGFTAALGILFHASPANATTYYWDTTAGTMTGGTGNWSLTDSNWSVSTTGDASLSAWTATGTDSAYFSTGSGTATITAGGVTVKAITFGVGTSYTINGGTLTVGSITTNASATINAPIDATGGSWTTAAGQTLTITGLLSGQSAQSIVGNGNMIISSSMNDTDLALDTTGGTVTYNGPGGVLNRFDLGSYNKGNVFCRPWEA